MEKYTNNWHVLPQYKECTCSFRMRLAAFEDTRGQVKYLYICEYVKCKKIEEVCKN